MDGRETRQECNECRRAATATTADYVAANRRRSDRNRTQEACNLRCEEYEKCLMIQLNMFLWKLFFFRGPQYLLNLFTF